MNKKYLFSSATALLLLSATVQPVLADTTYTVNGGDTLYSISRSYNVPVATIKSLNSLKTDSIKVGQKLVVSKTTTPSAAPSAPSTSATQTHKVKSGDTLTKIAAAYNLTTSKLMQINNLQSAVIKVGQTLTVSQNSTSSSNSTSSTTSNSSVSSNKGIVTANSLNVRNSPSATGSLLGLLKFNTSVDILETSNGWHKIKHDTLTGWVSGSYIKLSSTSTVNSTSNTSNNSNTTANSSTPSTASSYRATVTASSLNMRSNATTSSNILTSIPFNKEVIITSESGDWYKISYNGKVGWVSKLYVKKGAAVTTSNGSVSVDNTNVSGTASQTNKTYVVRAVGGLNLRSSASNSGSILTVLPNGASVTVTEINGSWYKVKYNNYIGYASGTYLALQSSTTAPSVNTANSGLTYRASNSSKVVVLDPGHGGTDPGAVNGKYQEASYTLSLAQQTKAYLESIGYKVVLTRTNSSCLVPYSLSPDLQCRVNIAKTKDADAFVSIHINSAVPGAIGSETYYSANTGNSFASSKLAEEIHSEYQPTFGSTNRGIRTSDFYVLRYNTVPSTLLEIGFISDSRDLARLNNTSIITNVSKAIAKGIDDYFN